MPDVFTLARRTVLASALLLALPRPADGQQPDSVMRSDSARNAARARLDSLRVDSVRSDSIRRSELARIRGELAPMDTTPTVVVPYRPRVRRVDITAASVSGDMIADLSPEVAARDGGSRIRMRDVEAAVEASYGSRVRGVLALTLRDDGSSARLAATDAAVITRLPTPVVIANLVAGTTALPFGRSGQLHRHALPWADQPLPVRVLLGANGLRGTGIQLRAARPLGQTMVTVDAGIADRFGARVDSLHPGEPPDQSLDGLAGGGRVGLSFAARGSRIVAGLSSISGKREQAIGCVYEGTVGPVPCPEGVNAANTRLTVLGADAAVTSSDSALVVSGEWLRMVVGATDLPAFANDRFAPFYKGLTGTYDGGYVDGGYRVRRVIVIGARGEWLQNPEVSGLNDAWIGGYVAITPFVGARLTASYQRRAPSGNALLAMPDAERVARDRVIVRGAVTFGRHPRAGVE